MFITATITDKANAPRIRRQLKKQGFGYTRPLGMWVKNCMSIRGARLHLPAVRSIEGAEVTLRTVDEFHAIIDNASKGAA